MTFARIRYPEIFRGKTKDEIEKDLNTIRNEKLKSIAKEYYLNEVCQIDIGFEYRVDRKTISTYLKKAINEIEHR